MTILDANAGYLRAGFDEESGDLKLFDASGKSLTGDSGLSLSKSDPTTGQTVIVGPDGRPFSINKVAKGVITTAKQYRQLQSAIGHSLLVKPSSGLIYLDPNRGSDENDGSSKGQAIASFSKYLELISASPLGSEVLAIAADAEIYLTSSDGVPGRILLPGSGTSASARRWITSYDPTGYFPTQKPRISYNIKPVAANWINESGNIWYIRNSDFSGNRNFGDNVLVILDANSPQRQFGTWVFSKASLTADKRYWADDTNKRLYLYSPTNPNAYYGQIIVAEGHSGIFGLGTNSSNWMIDSLSVYDSSTLVTLAHHLDYENVGVQNCVSEYLSNLVAMAGNPNATFSKGLFAKNRGVKFGGAAFNFGPGLYNTDTIDNYLDDGNYSKSVGGGIYINSHTAMTDGKFQGGNRTLRNYINNFRAGTSPDSLVDGAGIYIEQRSGGHPSKPYLLPNLTAQNIIENCENAFQDNSGMANIFESNLANNCGRYMLATDSNSFNQSSLIIRGGTFKGNGKISQESLVAYKSDAVIYAYMASASSLIVNDMVVDAPNSTFIRVSNGTLDLRHNTIPAEMNFAHNGLADAAGTARYGAGYLLDDYFAPPGDQVGAPNGRTDLMGTPVSPGSLRGAIT